MNVFSFTICHTLFLLRGQCQHTFYVRNSIAWAYLSIYQSSYLSNYPLFFITTCFIGSTIHYFLPIFMSFYVPQLLYSCFIYLFLRVSVALSQLSPSSFTELLTEYLPVNPFYIGSSKTLSLRSVMQRKEDQSSSNEIHMPYQRFQVAQQHARH
jgi:hypothetical protein